MLCCSFIAVLLVANLFNSGDAAISFTKPADGDGSASIAENSAVGDPVETITATVDGDLEVVLVTTDSPFDLALDGALTVKEAVLDFETTPSYTLLIRGQDTGDSSSATATLTVAVTNVNDDPAFASASYAVCADHGKAVGETVTTFSATDQDSGDTLTYSITSGNTDTDFEVSGANLNVLNALDMSTTNSYTLAVQVSDGTATATTNYVITVRSTCGASALAASLTALLIGLVFILN